MFCNIVLAQSSLPKNQSSLPKCQGTDFLKWTNCYGKVGPLPIDRDIYIGEWKDGKYHGQGTHTYSDGRKYVGEWEKDLWHGQATFTYPDGKVVKGIFRAGELIEQQ